MKPSLARGSPSKILPEQLIAYLDIDRREEPPHRRIEACHHHVVSCASVLRAESLEQKTASAIAEIFLAWLIPPTRLVSTWSMSTARASSMSRAHPWK